MAYTVKDQSGNPHSIATVPVGPDEAFVQHIENLPDLIDDKLPVLVSGLELPAGAATEATLAAVLADLVSMASVLSTVSTNLATVMARLPALVNSRLPVEVGNFPGTQPVSGAVTANLGTLNGAALDATLTNGTTKAIARGAAKGSTAAADATATAIDGNHTGLDVNIVGGAGSGGGASSSFGAAVPATGTAIGFSDGANMQPARVFDADTGAGTELVTGVTLRKRASGGSVELGTSADPVRTDPTGTTPQPVSGTVALGASSANIGNVNVLTLPATPAGTNNIGDVDVLTLPVNTNAGAVAKTADLDTGAGTDTVLLHGIAIPASGGAVAGGSATNPLRTDPTGTTPQPISGSVGISAGTNNIGDVDIASLPDEGQQNMAGSISVAIASDQSAVPVAGTVTATVHGTSKGATSAADATVSSVDGNHNAVDVWIRGGAGGGTATTDDSVFSPSSSAVTPAGGFYQATPDPVDEGDTGALGMTQTRALRTVVETPAGDSAMDEANNAVRVNVVAGGSGGGSSSSYGAALPASGTAVGYSDGTNLQAPRAFDADSGAGTEYVVGAVLRKSASGGSVEAGTSTNPLRTDPTGTTLQPVSGTVAIGAGAAAIGSVSVSALPVLPAGNNNIGDVDIVTLPTLPAGNNNIGDVDVASLPATTNAGAVAKTADFDTGAGTDTVLMHGLALPAAGGAVVGGTSTNPVRTDPTGTTTQPVSGTVALGAGAAAIGTVGVSSLPAIPAGSNNIGDVDVLTLPSIPAGTNNIGDVDVLTLPAIPAGNNNIGDVDVLTLPSIPAGNNNIGDVDIVSLPTLPAGTNAIGKLAANDGVDIGDVSLNGGTVAHDGVATAINPVLRGGYASAAAPPDVNADGDAVRAWHLRNGAAAAVITAAGALIGGDAANGLDVDVTRLPALAAGTNAIGTVGRTKGTLTVSTAAPTTTAASVLASNASRKGAAIRNNGSVAAYLGTSSGVTSGNGYPLLPGEIFEDDLTTGQWFAIMGSGTGDLRIAEVA